MPQLDAFTIFVEVFQFTFVFWLIYLYLLRKVLPDLYKTIKVRKNKVNSLNTAIDIKIPVIFKLNQTVLFETFVFYNALYSKVYNNYTKLVSVYNLNIFLKLFNKFIKNYKSSNIIKSQNQQLNLLNYYNTKIKIVFNILNSNQKKYES